MGDPKKKHKRYTAPKLPFDQGGLVEELRLLGAYGLRNKKELWRLRAQLSRFRRSAREIESMSSMEKGDKEKALLSKLRNLGIIGEHGTLDDILGLRIEDFLERRLQTVVYRKKMAKSFFQARQLITHGHVSISGRKTISPSYWVTIEDEKKISYSDTSPLSAEDHPLRKELSV